MGVSNVGPAAVRGKATLKNGSAVVREGSVTASSTIFLCCLQPAGTTGYLGVSNVNPGQGFSIQSSSPTDTSVVSWTILPGL